MRHDDLRSLSGISGARRASELSNAWLLLSDSGSAVKDSAVKAPSSPSWSELLMPLTQGVKSESLVEFRAFVFSTARGRKAT